MFAGKEVSRALGLMSLDKADCNAHLDDLTDKQLQTLEDWEKKFRDKYPVVGKVSLGVRKASQTLTRVC